MSEHDPTAHAFAAAARRCGQFAAAHVLLPPIAGVLSGGALPEPRWTILLAVAIAAPLVGLLAMTAHFLRHCRPGAVVAGDFLGYLELSLFFAATWVVLFSLAWGGTQRTVIAGVLGIVWVTFDVRMLAALARCPRGEANDPERRGFEPLPRDRSP
jgi:hypothetical protein